MMTRRPNLVQIAQDAPAAISLDHAVARVRIVLAPKMYLGPGKADLLEAIGRTGSIAAAGRALGMSYRRAWLLVDAVNQLFARPAVAATIGGAHGGGAELTELGWAVVAAYRRMEQRASSAVTEEFACLAGEFAQPVVPGMNLDVDAEVAPATTGQAERTGRRRP